MLWWTWYSREDGKIGRGADGKSQLCRDTMEPKSDDGGVLNEGEWFEESNGGVVVVLIRHCSLSLLLPRNDVVSSTSDMLDNSNLDSYNRQPFGPRSWG